MTGELKIEDSPAKQWMWRIVALLLVAAAGYLRWRASLGDFWLDEIWTWRLIQAKVSTDLDVFTNIKHDNNHLLNTWIMYRLGLEQPLSVLRLPAVLAGTGAVALAGWQARARGNLEALFAMLLTGWSFVLVHYSSEARGYAYLLFFTMLAYYAQSRFDQTRHWQSGAVFSLACIGGFLSQYIFAFGYVAFGVWQLFSVIEERRWKRLFGLLLIHAPPLALLAWLKEVNPLHVGGADIVNTIDVIRIALSLTIGGPEEGNWSWLAAWAASLLIAVSLGWLGRIDRRQTVFYVTAIVLAPVLVVTATGYGHLLPRHLLVPMLLVQLLFARGLAHLFCRGTVGRVAAITLLTASLAINEFPLARLLEYGRGNYTATLQYMSDHSRLPVLTMASDHDDRNRMIIAFCGRHALTPHSGSSLKMPLYINRQYVAGLTPEWYILHSQDVTFNPPEKVRTDTNVEYRLQRVFRYSSLSGWHWAVYQTETPTPPPKEFLDTLR